MSTWERVAQLPVEIESHELEGRELAFSEEFTRMTTLVHLRGGGHEGIGEDVVYDGLDHVALQAEGGQLPLAGSYTLESFSAALDDTIDALARRRRCATCRRSTGAGRSSPLRSTWRCARLGARSRTCSSASRGR